MLIEQRVLNDPTSTKYQKRAVSARRAFRGASAAWMLRTVDPVGADAGAMMYEMYAWCQTLPL